MSYVTLILSTEPHYTLRHIESNLSFLKGHYSSPSNMLSLYITCTITLSSFYECLNPKGIVSEKTSTVIWRIWDCGMVSL